MDISSLVTQNSNFKRLKPQRDHILNTNILEFEVHSTISEQKTRNSKKNIWEKNKLCLPNSKFATLRHQEDKLTKKHARLCMFLLQ